MYEKTTNTANNNNTKETCNNNDNANILDTSFNKSKTKDIPTLSVKDKLNAILSLKDRVEQVQKLTDLYDDDMRTHCDENGNVRSQDCIDFTNAVLSVFKEPIEPDSKLHNDVSELIDFIQNTTKYINIEYIDHDLHGILERSLLAPIAYYSLNELKKMNESNDKCESSLDRIECTANVTNWLLNSLTCDIDKEGNLQYPLNEQFKLFTIPDLLDYCRDPKLLYWEDGLISEIFNSLIDSKSRICLPKNITSNGYTMINFRVIEDIDHDVLKYDIKNDFIEGNEAQKNEILAKLNEVLGKYTKTYLNSSPFLDAISDYLNNQEKYWEDEKSIFLYLTEDECKKATNIFCHTLKYLKNNGLMDDSIQYLFYKIFDSNNNKSFSDFLEKRYENDCIQQFPLDRITSSYCEIIKTLYELLTDEGRSKLRNRFLSHNDLPPNYCDDLNDIWEQLDHTPF